MAITQQLARLEGVVLEECRRHVERLHEVCSFHALADDDYLDLEWAPRVIEQAAVAAKLPDSALAALRAAWSGEDEVNAAYRTFPNSVWEHPVTALTPDRVCEVDEVLRLITTNHLLVQPDRVEEWAELADLDGQRSRIDYFTGHFLALQRYYQQAHHRGLGIIMWWD